MTVPAEHAALALKVPAVLPPVCVPAEHVPDKVGGLPLEIKAVDVMPVEVTLVRPDSVVLDASKPAD
jgi:hypothetical protein